MSESNKRGVEGEPESRDAKRQANEPVESTMQGAEANQQRFVRCVQVWTTKFGSDPIFDINRSTGFAEAHYIILDNVPPKFKDNFKKLAESIEPSFPGAPPTLEVEMNYEEEDEFDTEIVKLAGLEDASDAAKNDFRIMLMDEEVDFRDATSTPYIMRKERYAGEDIELAPPLLPNQSLMIQLVILIVQHCVE